MSSGISMTLSQTCPKCQGTGKVVVACFALLSVAGKLRGSGWPSLRVLQFRKAPQYVARHPGDGSWNRARLLDSGESLGGGGMTFEKSCFIQAGDITGIEVKCSKCNYRWIRRVDNWIQDSITCANCGENWFIKNSNDLQSIKNFVASICSISEMVERQKGNPFALRFEIKCPQDRPA
jgi:ssDNA-binding Zn-finger/Zn-ribbon topoisomerase 1